MARTSIRPTTPADAPALRALMGEAGLHPNLEPADLEWKYWRPRADWPEPRSFVVVRADEILAHAGVVPGALLAATPANGTERIRSAHVIDWAARPSATGVGVMLMKYIGQTTDVLLAIGGSEQTRRLLPHLGFKSAGTVTRYVRSLHPTRILVPSKHPARLLLPRFVRGVLWSLAAPSRPAAGWTVRRLDSSELSRLASILPTPTRHNAVVLERGPALFQHTLACPIADLELYLVERAGRPRGYFLLAHTFRQARLADCWMDCDDQDDWHALIQCAALQAKRHPRAAELVAWGDDAAQSQRLRNCGFHLRTSLPVLTLAPRHPELSAAGLRVQMLDNDAAYLHGGRNEFLA
jgi:hypothetical protein